MQETNRIHMFLYICNYNILIIFLSTGGRIGRIPRYQNHPFDSDEKGQIQIKTDNDSKKAKKNFLDDDNDSNDDSLSLISSGSEASHFIAHSREILNDDKSFPVMFMMMFLITNILPIFVSCYYDKSFDKCVSWSQAKPHPIISIIYQVKMFLNKFLSV